MIAALLAIAAAAPASVVSIDATVTAYTPSVAGGGAGTGLTSTGLHTNRHPYGVAAAAELLPPGTWIRIPGYHGGDWHQVDDTGGAMREAAAAGEPLVDVRFRDRELALARRWGRQRLVVEIWTPDQPLARREP